MKSSTSLWSLTRNSVSQRYSHCLALHSCLILKVTRAFLVDHALPCINAGLVDLQCCLVKYKAEPGARQSERVRVEQHEELRSLHQPHKPSSFHFCTLLYKIGLIACGTPCSKQTLSLLLSFFFFCPCVLFFLF